MTSLQTHGDTHSSNMTNVKVYDRQIYVIHNSHRQQLANSSDTQTYIYGYFQHA